MGICTSNVLDDTHDVIELDELPLIDLITSKSIRNEHIKDKIKIYKQVIYTIYENEIIKNS